MTLTESYKILGATPKSSMDDIVASFRALAKKYHPDKNRSNVEWAHQQMTLLNEAYAFIAQHRFTAEEETSADTSPPRNERTKTASPRRPIYSRDELIYSFSQQKDSVNLALYKYYQYELYTISKRDTKENRGAFRSIVTTLRRAYHHTDQLKQFSTDKELFRHFQVYTAMIFNFYRSTECLLTNNGFLRDDELYAYQAYRLARDRLFKAEEEIMFHRHNRGHLQFTMVVDTLQEARKILEEAVERYSHTQWFPELEIHHAHAKSLYEYVLLFFDKSTRKA